MVQADWEMSVCCEAMNLAQSSGVRRCASRAPLSAPWRSSVCTACTDPASAARCSGVAPSNLDAREETIIVRGKEKKKKEKTSNKKKLLLMMVAAVMIMREKRKRGKET